MTGLIAEYIFKTAAFSALFILLIEITFRNSFRPVVVWIKEHFINYIFNILMLSAVTAMLTAAVGNWFSALAAAFALVFVLTAISYFKYAARNEPLFFADILLVFKIIGVADPSNIAITPSMAISLLCGIAALAAAFFLKPAPIGAGERITLAIISVLTMTIPGFLKKDDFTYRKKGFILGFMLNTVLYFLKIEPLCESQASRILPKPVENTDKPNIIVIQSESFFDITRIAGLKLSSDPTVFLKSLKGRAISGKLLVTQFGGGTCSVESEFLTGTTGRHFNISKPFYYSAAKKPIPSLASHLKNLGYETHAVHTFSKAFYNRDEALKNMGFDNFLGLEDIEAPVKDGFYVSDMVLTDMIINTFKNKDGPAFVFGISMENHQPYSSKKYNDTGIKIENNEIGDKLKQEAEAYIHALSHADRELKRLTDFVDKLDEPTVLLFYGDHLGALGTELEFYRKIGYISSKGELNAEDKLDIYSPDFLMLSNYKTEQRVYNYVGANFLSGLLLSYAGIAKPDLYHALDYVFEHLRCISRDDLFIDGGGGILEGLPVHLQKYDNLLKAEEFKAMGIKTGTKKNRGAKHPRRAGHHG